jgi:outer membrane protein assembly factor BamA
LLILYLDPKKSSQINALVGFLPNNSQTEGNKLLLTGEVNVNLKNALGGGETIGVNWQQLQVKSPRLNLLYQQPYIFHSPFGVDFAFDLYKKDSSYLNLNFVIGLQYAVSMRQTGRVFFQILHTNLLMLDTNYVKTNKALPPFMDFISTNLGIDYNLFATDYRFNPRKGNEASVLGSIGLRNIKENSTILALTTDNVGRPFNFASLYDTVKLKTYLIKLKVVAAHYFKLSKQSTLKLAGNGGLLQSEQIFNNEVFQIGG